MKDDKIYPNNKKHNEDDDFNEVYAGPEFFEQESRQKVYAAPKKFPRNFNLNNKGTVYAGPEYFNSNGKDKPLGAKSQGAFQVIYAPPEFFKKKEQKDEDTNDDDTPEFFD